MDSGNNSASLQSSSTGGAVGVGGKVGGGDEESDSRAGSDSFSSAFHTQNSSSSSMFDPFANYFNPISRPNADPPPPAPSHNYTPPNSLFNLDTDWSKTLRSDLNNNPMLLPSSSDKPSYSNNSLSFSTGGASFLSSTPAERGAGGNVSIATTTTGTSADQPITQPVRNPKKRSRASRRAPTTVLTTDTTNFRAMVQEFTGIPAPPFTSSYFPPKSRFDLFAIAPNSSIRSAVGAGPGVGNNLLSISQPPNYLRRPFPQKIHPPPFLSPSSVSATSSSSSSSSLMLSCLAENIASTTTSGSNSNINYQLTSELGLLKQLPSGLANSATQSSNLFDSIQQNSILASLFQHSQKYAIVSKDQEHLQMPANSNSQLKIGSVLEEYSVNNASHGHILSGLPNLICPEQAATSSRNVDNSINAANFHGDKVQETVVSRGGEGMVESWICSSD